MTKTTIFENIGWGNYQDATITITEYFTPSNDWDCAEVTILYNSYYGGKTLIGDSLLELLIAVTDEETGTWLFRKM